MPALTPSNHAVDVMRDRAVSWAEVLDVVENYQHRYPSTQHRGQPNPFCVMYQRGKLSVVVHEDETRRTVVTVLLREYRQWTNEDARSRSSTGGLD